jgi:taurine dioxygenase
MGSVKIRDIGPQFSWGSKVDGVTWDNIFDPALRADLNALFEDRGLLIFENMEPTPKMQVALSEVFGPLKDHPTKSTSRADKDDLLGVIDMHYLPRPDLGHDHGLTEVNGKKLESFLPWHFDHTYNDELNYAGVLRPVIIAPEGGRTGFNDGIELYNSLDPALIERIKDLKVMYTLDVRLTQMRFGRYFKTFGDTEGMRGNVTEASIFPRSAHPMIWEHKKGMCAHYCGYSAVAVEGHEDPEGEALFEEALQALYANVNPYWHDWHLNDMLIWDNARLLHSVEGCDPKYERRMQRTTIKGDYGLGHFEGGKKIGEVKREMAPLDLPA